MKIILLLVSERSIHFISCDLKISEYQYSFPISFFFEIKQKYFRFLLLVFLDTKIEWLFCAHQGSRILIVPIMMIRSIFRTTKILEGSQVRLCSESLNLVQTRISFTPIISWYLTWFKIFHTQQFKDNTSKKGIYTL